MLKTLSKLFRLKPYGNQLVDGMSEVWMLLAAINIAAIALCDAVAWGYFGYTTTQGWVAWLTAGVAGLIVLTLVGSLDAMFVMHDRTRRKNLKSAAEPATTWQRLRRNIRRDHLAMAARVVLVILTFTVTAPFLTQLFFARDIAASIQRSNEGRVAATRAGLQSSYDSRLERSQQRLATRQRDLEREIAGSGTSGRYGKGPTAGAIEQEIDTLKQDIGRLTAARNSELANYDAAAARPEALASRYGVDLVREGPDTRARVIAELEQSPSFRATRRTIKAFLLFMFLGLVCLKLFQPESVRIYYSAELQAAYSRLQAGAFDHRLDSREQQSAGGMTPVRFADWYENDQQLREVTDRLREQTSLAVERLRAQEEAVELLQQTLRSDLARTQEDLATAAKRGDELEQQVTAARQELGALNARIAEERQQLADFRYDTDEELSLRDQQLLISSRNRTARLLGEHQAAAARLTASLTTLTQRLEANRAWEHQLRLSLATAGSEATALSGALHEARQKRIADLFER
jgi:hypothetical protein